MTAGQFKNTELPVLESTDTCDKAMNFMDEFKLSHYPVVLGAKFIGLIYEEDIYEMSDWSCPIAMSKVRLPDVSIEENQHFLSVVEKIHLSKLSCLAIVDEDNFYLGVITRDQIVTVFGKSSIVSDAGSVIELEMSPSDYYLAEISRIIENTGVKILGTYIRTENDSNNMVLTIKLNKQEVEEVLVALERFGYQVKASYHLKIENDEMKDRYDNLMSLLNL